ncbi:hypothetical protein Vadar_017782 [Vaccinium darrowii]|uniref:Uncharacterized protein n=1 Tax=Vaccinium darrowii TaxID=229202 RepID=A0ACB7Y198_9ERIC|nr:hypothetical protein Vadar_017782 [Vaccinium darrowii]
MEILYASLLGFFLIIVIYLFFNKKSSGNANIPPGKTGFPVIGETLEFLSTGWKGHPEKFIFDRIAKYSSSIFRTNIIGSPMVFFCGLNDHRFLFNNENKLVQVWFPGSLEKVFLQSKRISPADEFQENPNFVRKFFQPLVLQGHVGLMDTIAHCYFVTHWEKKDTVVVLPLAKHYSFLLACRVLMSVEDPDIVAPLEKPFGLVLKGVISFPINLPGTPFNRAIKAATFIKKELLVIVKQRKIALAEGRASPTQDFLSWLLSTSDENGNFMSEEEIANKMFGMLIGSQDNITSVSATPTTTHHPPPPPPPPHHHHHPTTTSTSSHHQPPPPPTTATTSTTSSTMHHRHHPPPTTITATTTPPTTTHHHRHHPPPPPPHHPQPPPPATTATTHHHRHPPPPPPPPTIATTATNHHPLPPPPPTTTPTTTSTSSHHAPPPPPATATTHHLQPPASTPPTDS